MATAVAAIALAATGASTGTAIAVTAAAAVADLALSSAYSKKQQQDAQNKSAKAPRDVTIRSAVSPANIVYGQARVSGPIVYANTRSTPQTNDNHTLWMAIALANHACDSIVSVWIDGDEILASQIDASGNVTSGKFGPISGNYVTNFYFRLGSDGVPTFANANVTAQGAITELVNSFSDLNATDHRGRGMTYMASAFELGTRTGEGVWKDGAPRNVRAVVKGKKVYDPRKDSTNGGSGTHRLTDATTWEWSDNPALCLADYLIDDRLGMGVEGISYDDIDWSMVATAATACDVTVSTPAGNQKRFTCNGVLTTDTTYAENIKAILGSMMGSITWSGGKYRIRAGVDEAASFTFTEDDIVGDIQVQPELGRTQRFNKVRGRFIDPAQDYAETEFLPVSNATYKTTRDNGLELTSDITLPLVNNEYQAQRIAYKAINLNAQQMSAIIPVNWKGLKVAVGDRINVVVDELGWTSPGKKVIVDEWSFDPDQGFVLKVRETSSDAFADPASGDYSTRSYGGEITFAAQPVSPPSDLSATEEEEAVVLSWSAPLRPSSYDEIIVYRSATSNWSGAAEIGRTRGTTFRHETTYADGTHYYWVRSVDVDGEESIRNPNNDTTGVSGRAGRITTTQLDDDANFAETADWPSVTDSLGTRPENNATRNVIYQQAAEPTGTLNDGDLWIDTDDGYRMYLRSGGEWVDRSDTRIATAITNAAGAQATADGKVTTFYQDESPTAEGEGDLWIDTDDANKLYRWSGSAWTEVRDTGIAQAISDAADAQSTADGKIVSFYQDDAPTAGAVGDIWFDTDDANTVYRWNGTNWISARDAGIAQALSAAASAQSTADGKIVTFYQDDEPASASEGDLWIETDADNKLYRYNGAAWVLARDSGIAQAISDAATAQDTADGKVTTFYAASDAPPTAEATGDLWYQTDTALFFRWNGSVWQEVASYNTGALADLDTVDTDQIEDNAVDITKIADTLQSTNYSAGSAGWKLTTDGTFEAGNGTFRGALTATSLTLEGTSIAESQLASGVQDSLGLADSALQIGDIAEIISAGNIPTGQLTFNDTGSKTVSYDGNDISVTGGNDNSWDTQVYSSEHYASPCVLQFETTFSSTYRFMMGLNEDPTTNASYTSIDHAWYLNTSSATIYENGSQTAPDGGSFSYSVGDKFSIVYDGDNVYYYHNDTLKRTVTGVGAKDFYLDSSLYDTPLTINDVRFAPISRIDYGSIGGVTITPGKLYQGAGTFQGSTTGFYLDSAGQFSLKDKLSFDGSDLFIDGNVEVSEYVRAGSGSNTAIISGREADDFAFWAGAGFEADGGPSGGNAPFRVTRDGKVIMTNFALYSEAGTKLFDSQDGLLALPQTAVAQASGALVPQVSEELTSGTDTFTVTLSSTQTITANFSYPVGALYYSGTSLVDAQNNVSSAFAVTLQYSSDNGSTWNTFGSTQNFSKVTSGTPTSSQYLVLAREFTISIIYGTEPTTIYVASLQSNTGAIDEGTALVGSTSQSLGAGTYLIRMVFSATGGSGTGAPSTTKTREVRLSTSGAGFTVSDGTVSDGVGTSATTGWVLQNFVEKTESDNVTINGTLTLGGDLVVNGTTTTINSTTLEVADKNIVLADGAANAAAADGAGITIDGASASFSYNSTDDAWVANKILNTQRDIRSAGQVRATGWWNDAASTDYSGLGFEIGVSSGKAYALSYNRDTSTYGQMAFNASEFQFNNPIYSTGGSTTSGVIETDDTNQWWIKLADYDVGMYWNTTNNHINLRNTYGDLQYNGNKVWHAGNDGSGSTLDADLLDGVQGSSYLRSDQSDTMSGALSVTGNLNANTSGGLLSLGDSNSGDSAGKAQIYYHASGKTLRFYADHSGTTGVTAYERYNGTAYETVWDSGNDGSGSGLDADKLDSYEYTQFNGVVARYRTSSSATGRIRITLPLATNSSRMLKFTISQYSSYHQFNYEISGYFYSTTNQWHVPRCVYTGTGTPDIIVGRDANGYAYVSIANGNYTGIIVHSVTGGYSGADSDGYGSWTIAPDNGTENSVSVEVHKTWNSRNDGSGSGLDADLLDGIDSSSFLRSDTADTMAAQLTATNSIIVDTDWGNNTYSEALTVYGTYPSTTLRSTNANSGTGGVWLNHFANSGSLTWYYTGTSAVAEDWAMKLELLSSGRLDLKSALSLSGTVVLDSSRNLTNIGTISSGAISSNASLTLSGNGTELLFTGGNNRIKFSGYRALEGAADGSNLQIGEGYTTALIQSDANLSSGHSYQINGTTVIDSSRNLTNIGTISSSGLVNLSRSSTAADVNYLQITMPSWGGSQGYLKNLTWHDGGSIVSAIGSEFDGSKVNIHFHSQYNSGYKGSSVRTFSVYGNGNVSIGNDATIEGMTIIKRGIKASGHIRAAGWYNESADTGYEGMAFEIGTSGSTPYAIAYDRANSAYGPMKLEANSFQFIRGNVTVDNALTTGGTLATNGSLSVNDNGSGNYYLYLKKAVGGDGHLLFQEGSGLRWQNYASSGSAALNWYSYTAAAPTFQLPDSGGANIKVGGLQIGGVEVINSSRVLANVTSPTLYIDRASNIASGISWYSASYKAWTTYMTNPGTNRGPWGNITAPSGTLVTSWALRSFIENIGTYGWTFESGTSGGNPSVVAEIRASDGAARFGGTLYANGATGTGFAGLNGVAIGGQYPALSFESSSGYHKWLQYATSDNSLILYNATNGADVFRTWAASQTQQDIAFGTQMTRSWSSANRATFNINGNSSSLLGFHVGGATRGYLYATGSDIQLLSYGEVKLQANASSSYQATLNADGFILEDGLYANGIADRNGDILYPEGGTYKASGSSNVGAIKIRLPVNNSATMMKMRISVYLYDGNNDGRSFTLEVGGYNFSGGNWYNYFANIIGNTAQDLQFNVRFGHDGTKDCIWIGETTTNWPYVQVVVENVCPGYSNYSQAVWRTGWSVSLDTSLGTVERTITANQIGRHCRGNFTSAGNVTAYASDARLKKNVTPITNALEKVKRLRGVEFDWIDECEELGFKPDSKHETGVIAQEVQAVISDAVYPAPFNPDYLTVQKDKIVPVLINAVQELIQEVDSLKAKLKELENGND